MLPIIKFVKHRSSSILVTSLLITLSIYGYFLAELYSRPLPTEQFKLQNLTTLYEESELNNKTSSEIYAQIDLALTQQHCLTPNLLKALHSNLHSSVSNYQHFLQKLNTSSSPTPIITHAKNHLKQIQKDTSAINLQLRRARKVQSSIENLLTIKNKNSKEYAFTSGILENQLLELATHENQLYYQFRNTNIPSHKRHTQNLSTAFRHALDLRVTLSPESPPAPLIENTQLEKTNNLYPFSLAEMRSYSTFHKIGLLKPEYQQENNLALKKLVISKYIKYTIEKNTFLKGLYQTNEIINTNSEHNIATLNNAMLSNAIVTAPPFSN